MKHEIDEHRKDDRAVVRFHYRDDLGRRKRDGRWLTRIGPVPIGLGHGVKVFIANPQVSLYRVTGIGREGLHQVIDLAYYRSSVQRSDRHPRCVTYWPELEVGQNIVSEAEPWLSREPRRA